MQCDLSIVIPSRSPQYLEETVNDLLAKAEGDIEVIVVLDGVWPKKMLKDDKRVRILHHGTTHQNKGMRDSINAGMAIARGKYLLKIDEHCMVGQGYDKILAADCQDNWVVIPRRYRLDPDNWKIIEDGRPQIDYMYLSYPYQRPFDSTCGLHGEIWNEWTRAREDILIDDVMACQGSCYFMSRKHWDWLGGLDSATYGSFTQEAQEIGNKTWLGGGEMKVNKKTWYAHMHKGKRGKGYGFSGKQYEVFMAEKERGRVFCIDYWINNRWEGRVRDFEWLLEKFAPVPTWPENWKEQIKIDELKDFSKSPEFRTWKAGA
jgi:glycosyltransferase involved in cell wall biosynthesis